jgi:hypothetical protein
VGSLLEYVPLVTKARIKNYGTALRRQSSDLLA